MGEPADNDRDLASAADGARARHLPAVAGPRPRGGPEIVAVEARPIDRPPAPALPAPLAAALTGFLAGLATIVLARLLRGAGRRPLGRGRGRGLEREIVGSRSFLVDVHVLKR